MHWSSQIEIMIAIESNYRNSACSPACTLKFENRIKTPRAPPRAPRNLVKKIFEQGARGGARRVRAGGSARVHADFLTRLKCLKM